MKRFLQQLSIVIKASKLCSSKYEISALADG